ncbi:MAG: N-acetyl-alpha-D-glucosaminyl L-malate deacetylase 1 [Candidatus Woesearchaeota archaeon]|nr:MAG: N-acetyl-alpha-D-glucosaminyl L-malate deacetylase 1 [Candidatus Woesearchaeota archaeon]
MRKSSLKNSLKKSPKNSRKVESDPDSIMIVCAHSDDQIFGPGGTIAKYSKEGKKLFTIIFSYGHISAPLLKKEVIISARVKEAKDVDKLMGGTGVVFLGLDENKFIEQFRSKKMYPKLKKLILEKRPSRIFTHSHDDPHPDHRALNNLLMETLDRMRYKCDVYAFDIWTVFNTKRRNYPKIVIDISDTFKLKIKALRMFESQKLSLFSLMWSVYLKAWILGKKNGFKYAEAFYKIR